MSNFKNSEGVYLDQVQDALSAYLQSRGLPTDQHFSCLNPEHEDRNPSMNYYVAKNGVPHVHCHSCHAHYSLVDCLLLEAGLDPNDSRNRNIGAKMAYEFAGYEFNPDYARDPRKDFDVLDGPEQKRERNGSASIIPHSLPLKERKSVRLNLPDYTPEVEQAHAALMQGKPDFSGYTPWTGKGSRPIRDITSAWYYLKDRGISDEMIQKYKIGYAADGYNSMVVRNNEHPAVRVRKGRNGKELRSTMGDTINRNYRFILPYLNTDGTAGYFAAEVADRSKLNEKYMSGKYHKIRGLEAPIFNERYISQDNPPATVIVCEGYYDALAYESAGIPAIALIGVGHDRLTSLIEEYRPDTRFIIALDNDDAGKKGDKRIDTKLTMLHVPFIQADYQGISFKDANEFYTKDREGFIRFADGLKDQIDRYDPDELAEQNRSEFEQAMQPIDQAREEKRQEAFKEYVSNRSALAGLDGLIERTKKDFAPISTGFSLKDQDDISLDEIYSGGIRSGIYAIGAMPAAGKTTFSTQIMDNMAKMGHIVIYVSREMTSDELRLKSLSRETALRSLRLHGDMREAISAVDIGDGKGDPAIVLEAIEAYRQYAGNIIILDDQRDFSAGEVREEVEHFINLANENRPKRDESGNRIFQDDMPLYEPVITVRPIVFIDYLQILDPMDGYERATDKQIVDQTMKAIRNIYAQYKIPVIAISSFNRANYRTEASLEAYKDSGGIDFYIHSGIGLQTPRPPIFKGKDRDAKTAEFIENQKRTNEILSREGKAISIEAVVMKNRKGSNGKAFFSYYPKFDLFIAVPDPQKNKTQQMKLAEDAIW